MIKLRGHTTSTPEAWRDRAEVLLEPEQVYWLSLSMDERLAALDGIFQDNQRMGGSLEQDPDPHSPFWSRKELESFARSQGTLLTDARSGSRFLGTVEEATRRTTPRKA